MLADSGALIIRLRKDSLGRNTGEVPSIEKLEIADRSSGDSFGEGRMGVHASRIFLNSREKFLGSSSALGRSANFLVSPSFGFHLHKICSDEELNIFWNV